MFIYAAIVSFFLLMILLGRAIYRYFDYKKKMKILDKIDQRIRNMKYQTHYDFLPDYSEQIKANIEKAKTDANAK